MAEADSDPANGKLNCDLPGRVGLKVIENHGKDGDFVERMMIKGEILGASYFWLNC